MDFRIADTFQASLAKLSGDEQKAAKTTAFDLQVNPANPGMQFHRVDKSKDKNFWSARVGRDIRVIVHKLDARMLLCFVGHHDDAYQWAERRKIETHPKTGAAQIVEVRERVQEITIPVYVQEEQPAPPKPALFADKPKDELLGYGVPEEWLDDVKQVNEDSILELADHLPPEAAEALLELATGGKPPTPEPVKADADPFEHPDAQRRFRIMNNKEELERALEFPWDKWTVFLHPAQRRQVEREYNGPARVAGSAGTGKTIVALHRAAHLARKHPDARILLTTFSEVLAAALRVRLRRLLGNEPKLFERIDTLPLDEVSAKLARAHGIAGKTADEKDVTKRLEEASSGVSESRFTTAFLFDEWTNVIEAGNLRSWEEYRDYKRLGRKARLAETQRKVLWKIFKKARHELETAGLVTPADQFHLLAERFKKSANLPYDFAIVDEAQDVSPPQLRFLAALGKNRPDALFFAGDLGQRIFRQPFSWKALGVDVRGRSRTLRVNYRTSHQIRAQADLLLPAQVTDADGNVEDRRGSVSVFNGPSPEIHTQASEEDEVRAVAQWLASLNAEGFKPRELGVFVREDGQLERARKAVKRANLVPLDLSDAMETESGRVTLGSMHLAKGLEFRAVAVMACDDEVIPSQARIDAITDVAALEDVYETERHLLYVACTRARDRLHVSGVKPASEFLEDLGGDSV